MRLPNFGSRKDAVQWRAKTSLQRFSPELNTDFKMRVPNFASKEDADKWRGLTSPRIAGSPEGKPGEFHFYIAQHGQNLVFADTQYSMTPPPGEQPCSTSRSSAAAQALHASTTCRFLCVVVARLTLNSMPALCVVLAYFVRYLDFGLMVQLSAWGVGHWATPGLLPCVDN
jgi:hypothetical protein